jgi:hemoglobin
MTLLEELGGRDALELVVAGFHERVLGDPRLVPFFRGVSRARLVGRQHEYFAAVLGAPSSDETEGALGAMLRPAHAPLGIDDDQFDATLGHLIETLHAAGVARPLVRRVVDRVARLRRHVVVAGRP